MTKRISLRALIVGAFAILNASTIVGLADTVALSPTITTGGQSFDDLYGMDFNTNSAIKVTQLGVFDSGGDSILLTDSSTQPIVIQIWNRDTGLALATMNFGGGSATGTDTTVGTGKVFFQSLSTPLSLAAGGHYYISADFDGTEKFGNTATGATVPNINDGGGLITFVGEGRASNIHSTFYNGNDAPSGGTSLAPAPPATTNGFLDGGPANRYTGPDFQFTAIPEPGSLAILALTTTGLLARRRPFAAR